MRRVLPLAAAALVGLLLLAGAALLFAQSTFICNGLGECEVSIVTDVLSKGLTKVSSFQLINPRPRWPSVAGFDELRVLFAAKYPGQDFPSASPDRFRQQAQYRYTFFPAYWPVDLFAWPIETPRGKQTLYVEVQTDTGWVSSLDHEPPYGVAAFD